MASHEQAMMNNLQNIDEVTPDRYVHEMVNGKNNENIMINDGRANFNNKSINKM